MSKVKISNLTIDDLTKNNADYYQLGIYKVNDVNLERSVCKRVGKTECNTFRVLDLDILEQYDELKRPDIMLINEENLTKEEIDKIKKMGTIPIFLDDCKLENSSFDYKYIRLKMYEVKMQKYLKIVTKKIEELQEQYTSKKENNEEIAKAMLKDILSMIKEKDGVTYDHVTNVSRYVNVFLDGIPDEKKPSDEEVEFLKNAALVHDIGKLVMPNQILKKINKLDPIEYEQMKKHVENSELFNNILMEDYQNVALCHHERYDGAGYPLGLKKEEIPDFARVIAILDTFDALTGNRKYVHKDRKSLNKVISILNTEKGGQFDPTYVDYFLTGLSKHQELIEYLDLPPNERVGDNPISDEYIDSFNQEVEEQSKGGYR